jgi:diguanylate cyclase (GGDEF)-like protein/PAS domain S-box-containing protein
MPFRNELYKTILDNIQEGVYFVDLDRRITYWNQAAETITGYSSDEVVGQHCFHGFMRHVNNQGEQMCDKYCPLVQSMEEGRAREAAVYLLHKQGHRIPVRLHVSPVRDSDGAIIGAVEIFSDNTARILELQELEDLKRLALVDPLTGVYNRRYGQSQLRIRIEEIDRHNIPFGLLFVDIDNFKKINDSFGHSAGDEVLVTVARTLAHNLRSIDVLARWGGDEFVAMIPHIPDKENLLVVGDKLRALIENSSVSSGDECIFITVSIGAAMARGDDSEESILSRADRLMYQSKQRGGNAVTIRKDAS